MTVSPLLDDALCSGPDGTRLKLGLPWIRSLPLSAVSNLSVTFDGSPAPALSISLGERTIQAAALLTETGWWHMQDRLVIDIPITLDPGSYDVEVALTLLVPYLAGGPNQPLVLPLRAQAELTLDAGLPAPAALRDVTL